MKSIIVASALASSIASARPQPAPEELSQTTATWLSAGGTVAAYSLVALSSSVNSGRDTSPSLGVVALAATFVAPSLGHWYAGTYLTRGLGLRVGAAGVAFLGAAVAISCSGLGHDDDQPDGDCTTSNAVGIGLLVVGGGMFIGGTIDDIVQAPRRVDRINAERRGIQLHGLMPMADRDRVGLALTGGF